MTKLEGVKIIFNRLDILYIIEKITYLKNISCRR